MYKAATSSVDSAPYVQKILDGVEDEEASSDEITDEWDGRILSDVKRLPKFK